MDYDIDAVSLATFDIDQNGLYLLWSPYADISDIEKLHASETLPIPSGVKTEIKNTNDVAKALKIFEKYKDILLISPTYSFNKETKTQEIDPNDISVNFDLSSAESIEELGNLLQDLIFSIEPVYEPLFIERFNKLGIFLVSNIKQINLILDKLCLLIDKHNLYFDNIPESKLNRIINNRTLISMYDTINNPVNLTEAHISVDNTTGPLKDIAENNGAPEIMYEAKHRTPGNFVNKCESINENQVGKMGISICATGLKGFFALTQYNNYLLNQGTQELQGKLLLDHNGITIGDKTYKTLANIRSLDPNTITNENVLKALSETNNDEDVALSLSALLSLATDNAKELALSKLNAGTKTLGMYVYGLAIGMDFKDIAKLLMSKTGKTLVDVAESNVFEQTDGYNAIKDAFAYFDLLPNKCLRKYDIHRNLNGTSMRSPLEFFASQIKEILDPLFYEDREEIPFNITITKLAKSNIILPEKLKKLESLRSRYRTSTYGSEIYEQLIDFIESYIIESAEILQDSNTYELLRTLAYGADELKTLGLILGLNGGIKTDYEGFTSLISRIEEVIYKRSKLPDDILDLNKFVFDSDYRLTSIERYEQVKHTFNILDCIAKVPHFFEYVKELAVAQEEAKQSYKFRSVKNLAISVSKDLNYSKEKIAKGLQNYVGDKIRNDWMLNSDIIMDIPAGIKAFDRDGNLNELTESKPIKLGTDWGNATFRVFMETKVIPDLKRGIIKPGVELGAIKTNKFIKDLIPDLFTKTVSSNPTILYTLPINMLPRTDVELALLDSYIAEFNNLVAYNNYTYEIIKRDSNGNELLIQRSIPIKDLFVYYSMIAHNWKLGENSLVPILESFLNEGVIDSFHKYEAALDNSDDVLTNYDIREVLPYVAPRMSPYSAYTEYIKSKNPTNLKIEIMKKLSGRDTASTYESLMLEALDVMELDEKPNLTGYEFISSDLDTNYFTTGIIASTNRQLTTDFIDNNGNKVKLDIIYDAETGAIDRIAIDGTTHKIENLQELLVRKVDGRKVPRLEEMKSIIKNELYPCHV